jgi:hypothetical protein
MRLAKLLFLLVSIPFFTYSQKNKSCLATHETFLELLKKGEKGSLEPYTHSQLDYGHSVGLVENQTTFIESITNKATQYTKINSSERTVKQAKNTCAIRETMQVEVVTNKTETKNLNLKVLHVYVKEKTGWKLFQRQAVRIL